MSIQRYALGLLAVLSLAGAAAAEMVSLPKGTSFEVETQTGFSSNTAKKGDTFTARLTRGLWVEGRAAVPAGATVEGKIKVVRSKAAGAKSAAVGVKFERLLLPGGKAYPIDAVLTSFRADERRKILESRGKLSTGRKIDVVLIGVGTEANRKVSTLVGISGADTDDLADEWAASGLGPDYVDIAPGTRLNVQLDAEVGVEAATGSPRADDRNIFVSKERVKAVQFALKGRTLYAGEATGVLDQSTRDAIARFQIDQNQPATGDPDEATLKALGVKTN